MQQILSRFGFFLMGCIVSGGIIVSLAACAPGGASATSSSSASALSPTATSTVAPGSTDTSSKGTLRGLVEASPTCPVEQAEQPCPPKPVANRTVLIETPGGTVVTQVTTDQSGQFVIDLPAGTYALHVAPGATPFPIQRKPQTVTVEAGQTVQVTVELDSGIR